MNNAYGSDAISLGSILNRLCVQGYSDLVELRNKNEENGIGKELRSRRVKTYLIIQRHRFLQAYAILQWSAKSLGRLREAQDNRDKKIGLRRSIDYINSIINYVSSFLFVHDPQASWKIGTSSVPLFDVSSALDVVGNGSFSLLPRCLDDKAFRVSAVRTLEGDDLKRASRELSERFSVKETQKRLEYFDDSEILQNVIQKQDHLISLRLLRSRNPYMLVLRKISYIVVGSGCMQILVPDQFKVKFYLGGDIDKPVWQVLAVELLVRAENDTRPYPELSRHRKLIGDDNQSDVENETGKMDDEDTFNNNLVNSLGFLYPRPNPLQMNYLLIHMQTCMTKASENVENGNDSSLQAGLSCLFEFNIQLALSILYTQALRLRNSKWINYLDVEYVSPTEAKKSQYLKISFWPSSKLNGFASSIKIDIRESPVTKNQYLHCIISPEVDEETHLSILLNSHMDNILLNNTKIESMDLEHQSKHLGDIPDIHEKFKPNVSYNGLLLSSLNVEKLISLVVSIQTEHYLKKIRESLLAHVKSSKIPYLDSNSVSVVTRKMKTNELGDGNHSQGNEFEIYLKLDLPTDKRLILSIDNRTAKIVSFLIDIANTHEIRTSKKDINNSQMKTKDELKSQQQQQQNGSIFESILQKFLKSCNRPITESLAVSSKDVFELWANLSKASIVSCFQDAITDINRLTGSQYECSDIDPETGTPNSLKHLVSILLGSGENVEYYVNIKCKSVLNENWDGRLATAVSVSLVSYSTLSDGKISAISRKAIDSYPISISDEGKMHQIKHTAELITKLSMHAATLCLSDLRILQVRKLLLNIGFLESSPESNLLTTSIESHMFNAGLTFNILHQPVTAILVFISYFISGRFHQMVSSNIAMKINVKVDPCNSGYILRVMQTSDSGEHISSTVEEYEVPSLTNRFKKRNPYSDISLFAAIIDRARICILYSLFQSVLDKEKRKETPHLIESVEYNKNNDLGILFTIQGKSMRILWDIENESYHFISLWDPLFPMKNCMEIFMNEMFIPGHPIEEIIDALESILSTLSAWIYIHDSLTSNPNIASIVPISHRELKILLRDSNSSIAILIDSANEVHIHQLRTHKDASSLSSSMEVESSRNHYDEFTKMKIAEALNFLQNAR